jgi:aldose 1-epimerase
MPRQSKRARRLTNLSRSAKGHNVLRFPHASPEDYPGRGGSIGIPFLAPWADRLDEQAFYANGRRHAFDMTLGNIRGAMKE